MTIHIYKSTDTDAPQITQNANGSIINQIVKACLVTGYGNKEPAGWELVYENAVEQRICLRSNDITSTRTYFELKVRTNLSSSWAFSEISGFAAWTAEHKGLGLINNHMNPNINGGSTTAMYLVGSVANNVHRNWLLLANGKSVYLFLPATDSNRRTFSVMFFGDYQCFNPALPNVLIAAFSAGYNAGGFPSVTNSINGQGHISAGGDQYAFLSPIVQTEMGFGNRYHSTVWVTKPINTAASNYMVFTQPLLVSAGSNISVLGYLPGLLDCIVQNRGNNQDDFGQYHQVNGHTVMEIYIHASGTNFINLSEWA